MNPNSFIATLFGFAFFIGLAASKQRAAPERHTEQSHFSAEADIVPVERPVPVGESVMNAVKKDLRLPEIIRPCTQGTDASQIQAAWFVGSDVRLSRASERDLVVVPANQCMSGANVGPFWVVGRKGKSYELLVSTTGHDLQILTSRTNGYRDLQVDSFTAGTANTVVYQFDGRRYRPKRSKTEPI